MMRPRTISLYKSATQNVKLVLVLMVFNQGAKSTWSGVTKIKISNSTQMLSFSEQLQHMKTEEQVLLGVCN